MGEDVHKIFQQLTGMGKILQLKKLHNAPFTLHSRMLELIQREAKHGKAGHIIVKVNGLTLSASLPYSGKPVSTRLSMLRSIQSALAQ